MDDAITAPYCRAVADHYADAFTTTPGQCFRMVIANEAGHPTHCPVTTHGPWRSGDNRLYRVDACNAHKDELVAPISRAGGRSR